MACAILSCLACPAPQYFFFTLSYDGKILEKNIEHKMCFLFSLQLLSETFLILSGENYIMMSLMICAPQTIISGDNIEKNEIGGA
jgi:hypothetical protein